MQVKISLEKDKWTALEGLQGLDGNNQSVVITLAVNDNLKIYPINTNVNFSWYQGIAYPNVDYYGLPIKAGEQSFATYDGVDSFFIRANADADVILIISCYSSLIFR